jgi:hypothetical protein
MHCARPLDRSVLSLAQSSIWVSYQCHELRGAIFSAFVSPLSKEEAGGKNAAGTGKASPYILATRLQTAFTKRTKQLSSAFMRTNTSLTALLLMGAGSFVYSVWFLDVGVSGLAVGAASAAAYVVPRVTSLDATQRPVGPPSLPLPDATTASQTA